MIKLLSQLSAQHSSLTMILSNFSSVPSLLPCFCRSPCPVPCPKWIHCRRSASGAGFAQENHEKPKPTWFHQHGYTVSYTMLYMFHPFSSIFIMSLQGHWFSISLCCAYCSCLAISFLGHRYNVQTVRGAVFIWKFICWCNAFGLLEEIPFVDFSLLSFVIFVDIRQLSHWAFDGLWLGG